MNKSAFKMNSSRTISNIYDSWSENNFFPSFLFTFKIDADDKKRDKKKQYFNLTHKMKGSKSTRLGSLLHSCPNFNNLGGF